MRPRRPSRLALAVFDCFISNNDPLRGDLIEEFQANPSQLVLWRQVLSAIVYRPWPRPFAVGGGIPFGLLGVAMLALVAFEAVFATNVIHRFLFGPPVQDIRGALYLNPLNPSFHQLPASSAQPISTSSWLISVLTIASSLPIGWFVARVRERHRTVALVAFGVSMILCALANFRISLLGQFVTSAVFILGLLSGGALEVTADTESTV